MKPVRAHAAPGPARQTRALPDASPRGAIAAFAHATCRVVAVTMLAAVAAAAIAADITLGELMHGLAAHRPGRARFTERKFIAILDAPVVSTGELSFTPPDRLERKTLTPKPESLVVEKGMLTLERGDRRITMRLADYPQIAPIVDALRGMPAGDREALEKAYRLEAHGTRERWTLVMLPSDPKVAELVQRIDVSGTRDRVRAIEIRQTDGDRSVMTIDE